MNRHHKLLAAALGIAALTFVGAAGCAHGRLDTYGRVDIIDTGGFHHDGYYDNQHDWHGGWYDHDYRYHEDPHDWHR